MTSSHVECFFFFPPWTPAVIQHTGQELKGHMLLCADSFALLQVLHVRTDTVTLFLRYVDSSSISLFTWGNQRKTRQQQILGGKKGNSINAM